MMTTSILDLLPALCLEQIASDVAALDWRGALNLVAASRSARIAFADAVHEALDPGCVAALRDAMEVHAARISEVERLANAATDQATQTTSATATLVDLRAACMAAGIAKTGRKATLTTRLALFQSHSRSRNIALSLAARRAMAARCPLPSPCLACPIRPAARLRINPILFIKPFFRSPHRHRRRLREQQQQQQRDDDCFLARLERNEQILKDVPREGERLTVEMDAPRRSALLAEVAGEMEVSETIARGVGLIHRWRLAFDGFMSAPPRIEGSSVEKRQLKSFRATALDVRALAERREERRMVLDAALLSRIIPFLPPSQKTTPVSSAVGYLLRALDGAYGREGGTPSLTSSVFSATVERFLRGETGMDTVMTEARFPIYVMRIRLALVRAVVRLSAAAPQSDAEAEADAEAAMLLDRSHVTEVILRGRVGEEEANEDEMRSVEAAAERVVETAFHEGTIRAALLDRRIGGSRYLWADRDDRIDRWIAAAHRGDAMAALASPGVPECVQRRIRRRLAARTFVSIVQEACGGFPSRANILLVFDDEKYASGNLDFEDRGAMAIREAAAIERFVAAEARIEAVQRRSELVRSLASELWLSFRCVVAASAADKKEDEVEDGDGNERDVAISTILGLHKAWVCSPSCQRHISCFTPRPTRPAIERLLSDEETAGRLPLPIVLRARRVQKVRSEIDKAVAAASWIPSSPRAVEGLERDVMDNALMAMASSCASDPTTTSESVTRLLSEHIGRLTRADAFASDRINSNQTSPFRLQCPACSPKSTRTFYTTRDIVHHLWGRHGIGRPVSG